MNSLWGSPWTKSRRRSPRWCCSGVGGAHEEQRAWAALACRESGPGRNDGGHGMMDGGLRHDGRLQCDCGLRNDALKGNRRKGNNKDTEHAPKRQSLMLWRSRAAGLALIESFRSAAASFALPANTNKSTTRCCNAVLASQTLPCIYVQCNAVLASATLPCICVQCKYKQIKN